MKLEDLKKLCDEATPAHKPLNHSGIALDVRDADMAFIEAARTMLPKLIAVAEAAHSFLSFHTFDSWTQRHDPYIDESEGGRLAIALAALESDF